MDRREFLKGTVLTAAALAAPAGTVAAARGTRTTERPVKALDSNPAFRAVDANVTLFQWPFRRLPYDTIDGLLGNGRIRHPHAGRELGLEPAGSR